VAVNTFDISEWSVTQTEIANAFKNSSVVLADYALEKGYQDLYNVTSNCKDDPKGIKCLYLQLYMLQNYKSGTTSIISEETMINVLSSIEQLSKSCCNGV